MTGVQTCALPIWAEQILREDLQQHAGVFRRAVDQNIQRLQFGNILAMIRNARGQLLVIGRRRAGRLRHVAANLHAKSVRADLLRDHPEEGQSGLWRG